MDKLRKVLQALRAAIYRMSAVQKVTLFMFGGTVFVTLLLLTFMGMKSSYEVLYDNIPQDRQAELLKTLESYGVEPQVEGATIRVRKGKAREIYYKLARDGALPKEGEYGFLKMIKDKSFTVSERQRNREYKIALEHELQRIISNFESVAGARVMVSQQTDTSVFLSKEDLPTAAIQVKSYSSEGINPREARAIIRLVASSVKRLKPENVTLTDQFGNDFEISEDNMAGGGSGRNSRMDLRRKLEKEYEKKAEEVLGFLRKKPGDRVVAKVSVKLDLDKIVEESRKVNPDEIVPKSESKTSERSESSSKEGGAPGYNANQRAKITSETGEKTETSKDDKDIVYDYSTEIKRIEKTPGAISDLTVAIVIPEKIETAEKKPAEGEGGEEVEADAADGTPATKTVPYSPKRISEFKALVAGALGLKTMDNIAISSAAFPSPGQLIDKPGIFENIGNFIPQGFDIKSLFLLVLIAYALYKLANIARTQDTEEEIADEEITAATPDQRDQQEEKLRSELTSIIEQDPAKAASVVRKWSVS